MPTGIWSEPELRVATMLSVLEAFQEFVEIAGSSGDDAAELALDRIHYEGLPEPEDDETGQYTLDELEDYRPCAIVTVPAKNGWRARSTAEQTWVPSGRVIIDLYRSLTTNRHGLPTAADIQDFRDDVGEIIEGLLGLPWQEPYLAVRGVEVIDGPFWGPPDMVQDEGLWIGVQIGLDW